jgi:hypothetical protein
VVHSISWPFSNHRAGSAQAASSISEKPFDFFPAQALDTIHPAALLADQAATLRLFQLFQLVTAPLIAQVAAFGKELFGFLDILFNPSAKPVKVPQIAAT